MSSDKSSKVLIYSCSGCSSAAQLANAVAVRMDREGLVEMSCIAGVGGDVPSLVKVAQSGRPIIVLDGCPLQCAKNCLKRHGVKKIQHGSFTPQQAEVVYQSVRGELQDLASRS